MVETETMTYHNPKYDAKPIQKNGMTYPLLYCMDCGAELVPTKVKQLGFAPLTGKPFHRLTLSCPNKRWWHNSHWSQLVGEVGDSTNYFWPDEELVYNPAGYC